MNCFLHQDNVVLDMSALNEASLVLQNDLGKNFFDSVCYDFSDDFVSSIAERNGPEFGEVLNPFLFGN